MLDDDGKRGYNDPIKEFKEGKKPLKERKGGYWLTLIRARN